MCCNTIPKYKRTFELLVYEISAFWLSNDNMNFHGQWLLDENKHRKR